MGSFFFQLSSFNGLCIGPLPVCSQMHFSSFSRPAFIAGGFSPLQTTFPRLLCVGFCLGLAPGSHWPGPRRGKASGRHSLCPAASPSGACLPIPSPPAFQLPWVGTPALEPETHHLLLHPSALGLHGCQLLPVSGLLTRPFGFSVSLCSI